MIEKLPPRWAHQQLAYDLSQKEPAIALFWEVGTGKTRGTIDMLRGRCEAHGRLLKTIILSPKITLTNWANEIQKYSRISKKDILVLRGSGKKRAADFKEFCFRNGEAIPRIVICNYEGLQMEELFTLMLDWGAEVIIGDEIHRIKNPEAIRAKRALVLSDKVQYRYCLTGTPILKSPMDVFNIYKFMDGGKTFGANFYKFRSIWFEDQNAGFQGTQNYFPDYQPRADSFGEFSRLMYTKAIRAIKSECLDLPPFVRKEVHVELSKEQAKLYTSMKKEYVAYIDDITQTDTPRAVVANMAVVKALRLMQIVTGYAKTDEGEIHKIKENPRLDALEELLEEHGPNSKIIVWSIYHENYIDIANVCKKLGLDYTELHGQVPEKMRDANIKKFTTDPSCRVLIGNQQAGGIGINLVESNIAIFYSKSFSLEQDIQAEGRNYRGGSEQHKSVTRIDIIATGTIDELITQSLAEKQDVATKILDWRKDEY